LIECNAEFVVEGKAVGKVVTVAREARKKLRVWCPVIRVWWQEIHVGGKVAM
jgi:hypothetical protein